MSTCHCLATNVYVLMSTYHQCLPTYLYLPTIATYQHLASYVNLSTSTSTYPFKSLYNRRRPRSHRSCSSPLYFHISLSLSLLLCLPTYDPFPTLTSHSLSPSSLSLSFISATCIPIPIYLFLIAVDPRAGIGLVLRWNERNTSPQLTKRQTPRNYLRVTMSAVWASWCMCWRIGISCSFLLFKQNTFCDLFINYKHL